MHVSPKHPGGLPGFPSMRLSVPSLWPRAGPKPYKFIGFGDIHGPTPYKFIGLGDIHGLWLVFNIAFRSLGGSRPPDPLVGGLPPPKPPAVGLGGGSSPNGGSGGEGVGGDVV